ncbi:MAG: S8 family serine peptidase [Planctomycetota bacterium]
MQSRSPLFASTLAFSLLASAQDPTATDVRTFTALDGTVVARQWIQDGQTWASLSTDGRTFTPARLLDFTLKLRYREFDPAAGEPPMPTNLRAPDAGLWIVQYQTPGLQPWREAIALLGGENLLFLAHQANVWALGPGVREQVAALPFVRAVVPFHPAYKLEAALLAAIAAGVGDDLRVNVLTMHRGAPSKKTVGELVRTLGGDVHEVSVETHLMSVTVPIHRLPDLAAHPEVQWIDRWSASSHDMDIARNFHGANYVEGLTGVSGQGVRVEVMDGGCDQAHPDITNFAVHGSTNGSSAHGTCTSGIVVGTGAGNAAARGGVPSAFLAIADYESGFAGGSRYAHTGELVNPSLSWQCVLQSNSWGSAQTTAYNSVSQDLDLILFDHSRISILQSQSNLGTQSSRPQAWAKNIIAVGGIKHANTLSKSDDSWTGGASIGPAADGRIKPDLASFYDSTLCTDQVGSAGYTTSNYYSSFGGTSGATPICAGMLATFYQLWHQGTFGNPTSTSVFASAPQNTTAKAVLINSASQWTFSGTGHDLTRTHQGWGHPDLQRLYDLRNQLLVIDENVVLAPLQVSTHVVSVTAGTPELKVTMVFRDPPGTTSSTLHRINNLDLKVTAPGGTIYHGNAGLSAGNFSTSGGSPNTIDTVENVFVQNPAAGSWTVEVTAAELNQDNHVETGALDADFALVVSGINAAPPAPPAAPTGLVATAAGASQINLSWTDNASDEAGFTIERSTDGTNFATAASVGANVTSYADTGRSPGTTYWYRVFASNGGGNSAYSNVASATTATSVDYVATGQTANHGTVTGAFSLTQTDDGSRQQITEVTTSGNRNSLEHEWQIANVPATGTRTLMLQAHRTVSADNDTFTFQVRSGSSWVTAISVTKTADDNVYQTYVLPGAVSGTVRVRVIDSDNRRNVSGLDSVFVDHLLVRAQ